MYQRDRCLDLFNEGSTLYSLLLGHALARMT